MVYDMQRNEFPTNYIAEGETGAQRIRLSDINSFLEVQQVGMTDEGKLWMHSDPISQQNKAIKTKV